MTHTDILGVRSHKSAWAHGTVQASNLRTNSHTHNSEAPQPIPPARRTT